MEKLRKQDKEQGITLVALVITIVVMLTLAGVTINLTLGQNGIFRTAQKAAKNYTDAQEKEMEYLQGFTNEVNNIRDPEPLGTIIRTENEINYIADGAGNTIPVPAGFSPITTADQGTILTGFVIKNDEDSNEFVWVPVKGMSYAYDRYDFGNQKENYSDYSETLAIEEQISVYTYGGYYIGRYETGIEGYTNVNTTTDGNVKWTGYEDGILVVQRGKKAWNYITRDKAIEVSEGLYNKEQHNIQSKLCSSYAWDTALKFIETQDSDYITNPKRGNCYNTEFTYTDLDGVVQKKEKETNVLVPTGQTESVNNIYDMSGNVWEWTSENCNDSNRTAVMRGQTFFNATAYAVMRYDYNPTSAFEYNGFRIALFI